MTVFSSEASSRLSLPQNSSETTDGFFFNRHNSYAVERFHTASPSCVLSPHRRCETIRSEWQTRSSAYLLGNMCSWSPPVCSSVQKFTHCAHFAFFICSVASGLRRVEHFTVFCHVSVELQKQPESLLFLLKKRGKVSLIVSCQRGSPTSWRRTNYQSVSNHIIIIKQQIVSHLVYST